MCSGNVGNMVCLPYLTWTDRSVAQSLILENPRTKKRGNKKKESRCMRLNKIIRLNEMHTAIKIKKKKQNKNTKGFNPIKGATRRVSETIKNLPTLPQPQHKERSDYLFYLIFFSLGYRFFKPRIGMARPGITITHTKMVHQISFFFIVLDKVVVWGQIAVRGETDHTNSCLLENLPGKFVQRAKVK